MRTTPYRTITFSLILIFSSLCLCHAQASVADSLETELANHTRIDQNRIDLLNKLSYELHRSDVARARLYANESRRIVVLLNYPKGQATALWATGLTYLQSDKKAALDYFRQALHIAQQINDQEGICNYLMAMGNVSRQLGDIKTSDEALDQALQIAQSLEDKELYIKLLYNISSNLNAKGHQTEAAEKLMLMIDMATETGDKQMLSKAYLNLANIFSRQGNNPQALEYRLSALRISEQINDKQGMINAIIGIGGIKAGQNEYEQALETLDDALTMARAINDSVMISICLTNKGNVYQQMKHPDALGYLQQAQAIVRGKNISQTINLLSTIGAIYTEQGKFSQAEESLNEALATAQKMGTQFAQGEALILLSKLYYAQKQYARALDYVARALDIANSIKYMELQKDSHQLLSQIYAATGNYKEAFVNHVSFKQLNDSIFNDKNVRQIALLESAYKHNKEKQQFEIDKANQQLKINKQRNFIFALITLVCIVSIFLYQLNKSNKLKKRALQLEINLINSELEYSRKELTSATLKLMQNSESDDHCMQVLKKIESAPREEWLKDLRSLISYYKNKSVYFNWQEFETLFLKVNTDFYDKLNERAPTLTLNEHKLCVFLKLSMTNKDIMQITFQSEEAIKKARLRLRKKLELDRDDSLSSFIQNL